MVTILPEEKEGSEEASYKAKRFKKKKKKKKNFSHVTEPERYTIFRLIQCKQVDVN